MWEEKAMVENKVLNRNSIEILQKIPKCSIRTVFGLGIEPETLEQKTECQTLHHHSATYGTAFIGAFAKLQKVTISFVTSVCPSARNASAPTERILMNLGI